MSTNNEMWARVRAACFATFMTFIAGVAGAQQATPVVGQSPLTVGGNVPGNLVLVPSVEYPTLDSMANLNAYDVNRTYVGYFDSGKCYRYVYHTDEPERHFNPVRTTNNRTCTYTNKEWSGNFLNWAATQTIDPFRKALTGGYRVKDTTAETWVEKARSDGNGGGGIYPDRRLPASGDNNTLVRGATPADWANMNTRIGTLGNKMRFTLAGNNLNGSGRNNNVITAYNPDVALDSALVYEVSVRVKVCASSPGLEANCVAYGSNAAKPEGLIQKYAKRMRFSVFGYLNESAILRDGGVLRARQKFVGDEKLDPRNGWIANANREWDPQTGVLIKNPDPTDAAATAANVGTNSAGNTIDNSGVINYINKFGQMTTQNHKSYDPVSEMFYAALRYLKNQGNVAAYSNLNSTSADVRYNWADGFPVITDWDDPIQYSCQSNALLGIGDVNTHRDKNLPGNANRSEEPAVPPEVASDTTINVVTATQRVATIEGITIDTTGEFTGRNNSAYIAGLAYDANTMDLRPGANDFRGKQTASTYWVDVREAQTLLGRARNQYWLAAKYGGFTLPENESYDPYTRTEALPASWWASNETLSTGDVRPQNFYVASEAEAMVQSLNRAFARIALPKPGSGSSLGSNSTRIDTDTRIYQAKFYSGSWFGELESFQINTSTGALSSVWRASGVNRDTAWADRPIYVHNPQGGTAATRYRLFTYNNLGSDQRTKLGSQDVVNYLRGDRSKEQEQTNGTLRTRGGVLGDIVNSTPVFVGKPNPSLYLNATFTGASAYSQFAVAQADRTPMVYVGANDGMLHGFNGNTGAEVYAFVPNASIEHGMKELSNPEYEHRYFVDGEMAISDVYDTGSSSWKTVLVGTMGRGGPGVFALDITNPASVQFLWEKSATDIPALGKNIGRPVITQVANGDWRVIFGNGADSTGGSAQLVMIGVFSGTATVANTGAANVNALSAVLARDTNLDGFADTAFAGDLRGNLWKFTGLSGTPTVRQIFAATDPSTNPQPITAAPLAGRDPNTGALWVFFGTGRYLNTADIDDHQVQTWYGIKDEYSTLTTRSELVRREILTESRQDGLAVRTVQTGDAGELGGLRGWYMDLVSPGTNGQRGERMVVPNRFQGAALIGTTRIPAAVDPCNPTGTGFIMAINPFTGGRLDSTFFDVNRDSQFNNADLSQVDGNIISGIGFDTGSNNPNFVENEMYVSLDDGSTEHLKVQGGNSSAGRLSWRELVN
ncbi:pilus assembly protein [Steroidobacter cummioxidans]|uniref:pilus assembly protein n=1 Tax=Steroidobacter cummioxidans TaxID=1803913 RepID=UPI0019D4E3DC|nr:PilC/PilY family type IV pilus protein [Steroidobacter cummioxidans]